jgi:hypothetical protein
MSEKPTRRETHLKHTIIDGIQDILGTSRREGWENISTRDQSGSEQSGKPLLVLRH